MLVPVAFAVQPHPHPPPQPPSFVPASQQYSNNNNNNNTKLLPPKVAIKKVPNMFEDLVDAKRILREIKLLLHFKNCGGHQNIVQLRDIMCGSRSSRSFEDCYIVLDACVAFAWQLRWRGSCVGVAVALAWQLRWRGSCVGVQVVCVLCGVRALLSVSTLFDCAM
jgi:hypothetical protein